MTAAVDGCSGKRAHAGIHGSCIMPGDGMDRAAFLGSMSAQVNDPGNETGAGVGPQRGGGKNAWDSLFAIAAVACPRMFNDPQRPRKTGGLRDVAAPGGHIMSGLDHVAVLLIFLTAALGCTSCQLLPVIIDGACTVQIYGHLIVYPPILTSENVKSCGIKTLATNIRDAV